MLKLIGAGIIITSGALWGFLEAYKLSCRVLSLEKIIFAIKLLENEIAYGKRDIKNTLSYIGKNYGPDFLFYAAENIETMGIKNALSEEVRKNECGLLGTDKSELEILWENLGMTDTESQIKTIRHVLAILEKNRACAEEEYAKCGRLKKSMGLLGGIFIAIILL